MKILIGLGLFCCFSLSWSLTAAQSCKYTVSTTTQLLNVIASVCGDSSLYEADICLLDGSVFSGALDTSHSGCSSSKQFTISGPASGNITFAPSWILWTLGPLTLQQVALDVSRETVNTSTPVSYTQLTLPTIAEV